MKTREGMLILAITTALFGLELRTDLMAQEEQPGFRNEQKPTSKVPQPNPIFPRPPQPDTGISGPNTPRLNHGLPQEMPLPRTSRPAEVIEEKMVISPTDIRRAQEALHRIADVVAAKDLFDVLDDVRVPVNDELAVDVGFAVRVALADLGPVTVGVSEDELELRHDSPLAHPGAGGRERSGREESGCVHRAYASAV